MTALVVLSTVLAGLTLPVLVAGSATAATRGIVKVGTPDAATGFPRWYEDSHGVRLEPCVDSSGFCALGTTLPDPAKPAAVPDNFPDETFYYDATSTMTVAAGIKATLTMAVEAAFGNVDGDIVAGDQITFSRIQVKVPSGLRPGATYTITSPYGVDTVQADDTGAIRPPNTAASRYELGCGATPPDCDFGILLDGRVGPFLVPNDGSTPPPGYLGDGVTTHTVTGSPLNTNYFRIDGPGIAADGSDRAETDQFTVTGKVAGPIQTGPSTVRFPGTDENTAAAQRQVTVTNLGQDELTLTKAATETQTDFTADLGDCAGAVLARDDTCTVDVDFTPSSPGAKSDTLVLDAGTTSEVRVPVSGLGRTAGTAAMAELADAALAFPDTQVGATSDPMTTVVHNNGDAPLSIFDMTVTGDGRREYALDRSDCPDTLDEQASCTLRVRFAPHHGGVRPATLTIDDDAGMSQQVSLTGTGLAGLVAASPSPDTATGFPRWYEDSNGVRLQPCLDVALCPAGATLPDGGAPAAVPGNFPDEGFYFLAESTMSVPGVAGGKAEKAVLVTAVEAAFGNVAGVVVPGEQITFSRIQVKVTGGLKPGATYTITDPYGTETVVADADGGIKPPKTRASRYELGCGATPPACDFGLLLGGRIGPFLTQDPSDAAPAPDGFLGDGVTAHKVVGSPFGHNFFRIEGPNPTGGPALSLTQPLFTLNGMVSAGPSTPVLAAVSDTGSSSSDGVTKARSLTFTGGANAHVPVTLYVDGVPADTQTSDVDGSYSLTAGNVSEGTHDVTATELLPSNQPSHASPARHVTVDLTAPEAATITSTVPGSPARSTTPFVLGFAELDATVDVFRAAGCAGATIGTGTGERFGIGITATVPADQTSPLFVRQTDLAGNVGVCSSSQFPYTHDGTPPPAPTFGAGTPSGTLQQRTASVTFLDGEPGTFECRLDGAAFAVCASPMTYGSLADGVHTVQVRAVDVAGNTGPPASRTWTVATAGPVAPIPGPVVPGPGPVVQLPPAAAAAAPTILAGPTGATAQAVSAFAFASSDPAATFACGVAADGAPVPPLTPCTSPTQTSALGTGTFRFFVRSTSSTGSFALTSRLFVVDRTAPASPLYLSATTASRSAIALRWRAVSDSTDVIYRVYRDGSSQVRAVVTGTGWTDTGLRAGTAHTYRVSAADSAGNVSGLTATVQAATSGDVVRPRISATPRVSVTGHARGLVKASVSWRAIDAGGIRSFALWQRTGHGAWHKVVLRSASARTVHLLLKPGRSYRFRVMATDLSGNRSPRVAGAARVVRLP